MADTEKRALIFVPNLIQDYVSVLEKMCSKGCREFVVYGDTQKANAFLERVKEYEWPAGMTFQLTPKTFNVSKVDGVFLFISNEDELPALLLDKVGMSNVFVVAPITDRYFKKRPVFAHNIPKSGMHMLLGVFESFGLSQGNAGKRDVPQPNDVFVPGVYHNLQAIPHDELMKIYEEDNKFSAALSDAAIVFLYRDPRDIAVSMSYFLGSKDNWKGRAGIKRHLSKLSADDRLMAILKGDYPSPVYWSRLYQLEGGIRDHMMMFAGFVADSSFDVIPCCFEDMIGPKGGGNLEAQIDLMWTLQLKLQIPGVPAVFAKQIYNPRSPSFRRGQIGDHRNEFNDEHRAFFESLPQDFMEIYGYE